MPKNDAPAWTVRKSKYGNGFDLWYSDESGVRRAATMVRQEFAEIVAALLESHGTLYPMKPSRQKKPGAPASAGTDHAPGGADVNDAFVPADGGVLPHVTGCVGPPRPPTSGAKP